MKIKDVIISLITLIVAVLEYMEFALRRLRIKRR